MPKSAPARPYREFGLRLKDLMAHERMNMTELAAAADISISYPSKFISGESRPRLPILRRLAAVLHADFDELAGLCGYLVTDDRVHLPRWDELREVDQQFVRQMVEHMAELNAQEAVVIDERPARAASSRGVAER